MSQTSTPTIEMSKGISGQLASGIEPKKIATSIAKAAAMVIGRLAVYDQANGDDAVKAPAATGDITNLTKGIVLLAYSQEVTDDASPVWPQNSALPVLQKGEAYVAVEDAVAAGNPVFARHAAGNLGAFRSDADGGDATLVPSAVFKSSTTGAGIAIVEINRP